MSSMIRELGRGIPVSTAMAERVCDGLRVPALSELYVESEYLVSGVAQHYTGRATGPATPAADVPLCPYTTRVMVRRPRNHERFSGRVIVEPFNTSSGTDHDALWCHVGSQIQRHGDGWIAVSTRALAQTQLRELDASRYAEIDLPTNDLGWDILTRIGALVRSSSSDSPFRGFAVNHVYLGGYSQSGTDTATYAMAFGNRTKTFDGYFPSAHAASLTPIASGTSWILDMDIGSLENCHQPVMDVEPQTDVEGFTAAITPDQDYVNPGGAWVRRGDADESSDRYCLYEIAGAPHVGHMPGCAGRSDFPASAFLRAALVRLTRWTEDGIAPPTAPRIALAQHGRISEALVDEFGNALGGVRSPYLQVPLARYEVHSAPGILCKLAGRESLLPPETLRSRYGAVDRYLKEFARSLDATIADGFLLPEERTELLTRQSDRANRAFATAP